MNLSVSASFKPNCTKHFMYCKTAKFAVMWNLLDISGTSGHRLSRPCQTQSTRTFRPCGPWLPWRPRWPTTTTRFISARGCVASAPRGSESSGRRKRMTTDTTWYQRSFFRLKQSEQISWCVFSRASLCCRLLSLLANIRKGWKGLLGTNTLTYFASSSITIKLCNIGHSFLCK